MPLYDFCMQFDHYRPVEELGAARFARTADQLVTYVNAYLENPALDREGRRRLVALEVGQPLGTSTSTVIDVLTRLASAPSRARVVAMPSRPAAAFGAANR
jgi:hypothetical protein